MKKIDIIWNVTQLCPWACSNCCVDAVETRAVGEKIILRSSGLAEEEILIRNPKLNAFDQALTHRQTLGLELNLAEKMQVLEHLKGFEVKVDFSGGDVLVVKENIQVLGAASSQFGKENVTLTATGVGLYRCSVKELAPLIGELNFTYDTAEPRGNAHRQAGYASGNLKKAREFVEAGVPTRAECPLSLLNIKPANLRALYQDLHESRINKLLLMRLFPSGRGALKAEDIPSAEQYREAIALFRCMEAEFGHPQIRLQCALRLFDNRMLTGRNPCDLLHESLGLLADGTLLLSPWAIDKKGRPLSDSWILGNLAKEPLGDLLSTDKAESYFRRLDQNFGHCKIFSFFNSSKPAEVDRIFDRADPLNVTQELVSACR